MGTNYYIIDSNPKTCGCCGQQIKHPNRHLGKSSAGWPFLFDATSMPGIKSWRDLRKYLVKADSGYCITDEYNNLLTVIEFMRKVECRLYDPYRVASEYRKDKSIYQDDEGYWWSSREFS